MGTDHRSAFTPLTASRGSAVPTHSSDGLAPYYRIAVGKRQLRLLVALVERGPVVRVVARDDHGLRVVPVEGAELLG